MCTLGGVLACTSRCNSCRSHNSPCVRSCPQARQKDGDRGLVDNERDSAPPVQFLGREPLPRLSGEESGMLCVQLDPAPSSSSPLFPIIATAPSMTEDWFDRRPFNETVTPGKRLCQPRDFASQRF